MTTVTPPSDCPSAPSTAWPTHWGRPTGFAWYVKPAALVTQSRGTRGTLEASLSVGRIVDAVLSACADDVAREGGLLILHDWRHITTWDADARRHMMQRVRDDSMRKIRRVVVVMNVSPIIGAALQTACMLYSLAGTPMQVSKDVTPILLQYGIAPPGPLPARLAGIA